MIRRLFLLLLVLAFTASCALRTASKVTLRTGTALTELGALQDLERHTCNPNVVDQEAIPTCQDTAIRGGLTTEAHRAISRELADNFGAIREIAEALRAMQSPATAIQHLTAQTTELGGVMQTLPRTLVTGPILTQYAVYAQSIKSLIAEVQR